MFGYFVRKVDKRFQLERSLGLLEGDNSDAVQRLERLFARVGHATAYVPLVAQLRCSSWQVLMHVVVCRSTCVPSLQTAEIDVAADPDKADSYSPVDPDKAPPPPSEDEDSKQQQQQPKKGVLRDYIESFDQQTLADTARCGARQHLVWRVQLSCSCRKLYSCQFMVNFVAASLVEKAVHA